jgi:hypothetical protein
MSRTMGLLESLKDGFDLSGPGLPIATCSVGALGREEELTRAGRATRLGPPDRRLRLSRLTR